MFPRQVYFYFCQHFHIEYLKMTARVVLHFSIALQMTNLVQGGLGSSLSVLVAHCRSW